MIKKFAALIIGLVSLIYVFNPTAGILEIIPDNLLLVGNIDEAAATAIIIAALRVLNVDLTKIFEPKKQLINILAKTHIFKNIVFSFNNFKMIYYFEFFNDIYYSIHNELKKIALTYFL